MSLRNLLVLQMALIFLIMMGGMFSVGVGVLSAIGFGLWKWQGKPGALGGAFLLGAALVWMILVIADNLCQTRGGDQNVQAVGQMGAWCMSVPCVLSVLGVLWMLRLASR